MEEKKALVFDIGRFRSTDGVGIRTIIFFKGCPLRCLWCSNPFGLSPQKQLVVNRDKCSGCGACVEACPHGVNVISGPGEAVSVAHRECLLCGQCVKPCIAGARMISGVEYTARELFHEANKDAMFYRRGGGGVTLSGGEVLLQHEVAAETLRLCREAGLNTCIETSGFAPWAHLWLVAQYCHTVFYDVKHMDREKSKALTGASNEMILDNLQRLCHVLPPKGGRVIVRMPVVPGYNDTDEEIIRAARFVATLENHPEWNLLLYHDLGASKYAMIGQQYALPGHMENRKKKDARIQEIYELCKKYAPGIRVSIGGDAIQRGCV